MPKQSLCTCAQVPVSVIWSTFHLPAGTYQRQQPQAQKHLLAGFLRSSGNRADVFIFFLLSLADVPVDELAFSPVVSSIPRTFQVGEQKHKPTDANSCCMCTGVACRLCRASFDQDARIGSSSLNSNCPGRFFHLFRPSAAAAWPT